jgi:hypothetical protein
MWLSNRKVVGRNNWAKEIDKGKRQKNIDETAGEKKRDRDELL